ncbi:thioester reductase domain-containing protein [Streptomyces cellostaticus]|uniref:thioester reductase domain-containing protein n=1 Tax=Streptomyces cellostaticus TaxID=67285 RepID=UPI00295E9496|nr:thioester reductase domain-containing protein [Streptomyces cellostaticus]
MNEDPAYDGRRAVAESIERGGGGLDVAGLLAKVRAAGTATEPAPAPDLDGLTSTMAAAVEPAPTPAAAPDPDREGRTTATVAAVEPAPTPVHPAPDLDSLAATIAAVAGRHLPSGRLAPDADFFDAGGTSVDAVELVAELERELGIEVDLDEVFADARPASLARRWLPLVGDGTTPAATPSPPLPAMSTLPAPAPAVSAVAASAPAASVEGGSVPVAGIAPSPVPASSTFATSASAASVPPASAPAVSAVAASAPAASVEGALVPVAGIAPSPVPASSTFATSASAASGVAASAPAASVEGGSVPVAGIAPSPVPASSTFAASAPAASVVAAPAPAAGIAPTSAPAPSTFPAPAPHTPPAVPATPSRAGDSSSADTRHTRARPEDLDQILADLALADRLPFTDVPEPLPPRRVLLTGATGFLGSHMLLDLLRHSDAHVYCLVRAADEEAATARLGAQLRSYKLPWSSEVRRRITVVPGDIRHPRLGLTDEQWHTLAHELDSVVGVAAAVDFLRGYPSLRGSNVLGALTLAELAATGRPKPLHHISSIAVFNEVGITSMGEDDPLAHVDRLISGYDQSKWAAEVALRRARDHGLVVTALRPGGIGGHTRTGAYNPQDLSSGLISAFGRLRTVPAFRHLNAAPVDWVSRVAVAAICEPDAWGFDYNLTGVPNTLDDVVRDMALGGMHVRVQDWDEWRTDTLARLEAEPVPELAFLSRVLQSPTALKLCEATLKGPAAGAERTDALVAALGLTPAARYDAQAQLKTFEQLAGDGLARLPHKDDQPYLWFAETTEGAVGPVGTAAQTPCSMALTLSIASMYQLVKERRVDVTGEVTCAAIHPDPLTVERGDVWVRPDEGIPQQHGLRHQLLRYRLALRDADGGLWWLEGRKYARARRDLWRQTRALTVEIGRDGEAASLLGEVVVPADSYVRDQIDGIQVDPRLTGQEKRAAKLTWLAWFGLEMGRGLVAPFARAAADLLDLRRTPTLTEHHR